ncbi:MAG TPA: PaaI family thioesterase [Acidimicrobiales bacterium]|nr:PaaI family thioesterase [Acidimicrobiales bacterium]
MTAVDDPSRTGDADAYETPVSPARLEAAAVMRRLGHAIIGHEVDDETFARMTTTVEEMVAEVEATPPRRRPTLHMNRDLFVVPPPQGGVRGSHFTDCIVTGPANPMGVAAQVLRDGDDAVLRSTLGDAFEGAPGRAHGGVVAALFDEAMGFVLSIACTPAFTGRLTVTYRAPVPIGFPLEFRARLTGREGRKLLMAGEARAGDAILAEAEALFVAVDPERFASGGD